MLSCRCGHASCGYLLYTLSLFCLSFGATSWDQAAAWSLKMCFRDLKSLKSLKMCFCCPFCWGGGGNFPWRNHGIQLEAASFSVSSSVCETNAWLRASYAERPKWDGETRSRAGWDESCPSCRPPGACFPAAILPPQPPPVLWLQKPAEVQPTFAACSAKMSQSLRLLMMTEAQLTHRYLVRGICEQQQNIVRVSDVPNLFLLAAKSNSVCYRRAIGNFNFFFLFGSRNCIVICSINEPVCVLTGKSKDIFIFQKDPEKWGMLNYSISCIWFCCLPWKVYI